MPDEIRFLTSNAGKVEELQSKLRPLGISVVQDNRGYPEIQAESLEDVATAAVGYLMATGVEPPFLLEDAGLFVTDLSGFPGVFSSFVMDTIGCDGLLNLLQGKTAEGRAAEFRACLTYVNEEGDFTHFIGECSGRIAESARGDEGFGFDPIFIPNDADETFAQMTVDEKNAISHRGRAVEKFVEAQA